MNIKNIEGDLFGLMPYTSPYPVVIPHVCNNIGGWGSGFVIPLAKKFPEAEQAYRQWCEKKFDPHAGPDSNFQLGNTQFVLVNSGGVQQKVTDQEQACQLGLDVGDEYKNGPIYVANMIAQHSTITHQGAGARCLRYDALVECMNHVANCFNRQGSRIHCPKFGGALAGGNWDFIAELIQDIWINNGIPTTVYEYVPPAQ